MLTIMPRMRKPQSVVACRKYEDGFWVIDGQHVLEAVKQMQRDPCVPQEVRKQLSTLRCEVVWSSTDSKLVELSRRLNSTNKLVQAACDPILYLKHARAIWMKMGSPQWRRVCKVKRTVDHDVMQWDVSTTLNRYALQHC